MSTAHAARPDPAAGYVEKSRLAELVRDYRSTGTVGEELALVLLKIAGGVHDRYHFTRDREDFVQDVTLHLLAGPVKKADPDLNVFSYLTTCAIRYGGKLRNREKGRERKEARLKQLVSEAYQARHCKTRSRRRTVGTFAAEEVSPYHE